MRSETVALAPPPARTLGRTRARAHAGSFAANGLAVADQVVFSGANFLAGILLARSMRVESYGAFSLALAAVFFLSAIHDALMVEPASILGPLRYSDRMHGYFAGQFAIHAGVTSIMGAGLAGAGAVVAATGGSTELAGALVGAGLALPALLLVWLVRRFAYISGRPGAALATSGFYAAASIGALALLAWRGTPRPLAAFAVLAAASLCAATPALRTLRRARNTPVPWQPILRAHWRFGRWAVLAALAYAGAQQVQLIFVGAQIGLKDAGALRAMQLLTLPMIQAVTAVAALNLPKCARDRATGDGVHLRDRTRIVTAALSGTGIAFAFAMLALAPQFERLLFGGRFADHVWLARTLGFVPFLSALAAGLSLRARSSGRLTYFVAMAAVTAPVAVASTIGFTLAWGLEGAAASMVLTAAASAAAAAVLYAKERIKA